MRLQAEREAAAEVTACPVCGDSAEDVQHMWDDGRKSYQCASDHEWWAAGGDLVVTEAPDWG
jgi:4-hydroxy-3-methylbut-2-en-1-yl diphosphate synthase IspG/GcpE